jgi:hypothetical protein
VGVGVDEELAVADGVVDLLGLVGDLAAEQADERCNPPVTRRPPATRSRSPLQPPCTQ